MINITKEVTSLLQTAQTEFDFDLLFAIQRKGMAHLKMVPAIRKLVGRRVFFLDAIRFIEDKDLYNSNVLIYDDACQTGSHIIRALNIFRGLNCSVKTAVLAIHDQCRVKPDFQGFSLPSDAMKQILSITIDEKLGEHIYDDHLVLRISARDGDYDKLLSMIKGLGQLTHITRYFSDDMKAITLEKFTFFDVVRQFEGLVERDGVEKLRLFFKNDGNINIVPRIYPAILLDRVEVGRQNGKVSVICNSFPPLVRKFESDQYPYVYSRCMTWTINAFALSAFRRIFLQNLKKCGYRIAAENINEPDIRAAVYHGDNVIKAIKETIELEGKNEAN